MTRLRATFAAAASIAALAMTPAYAQSHPEYVPLGRVQAALYKPDSGPAPHVAFLVAHRTANNLATLACTELAKRGFMVVCFNTRFINNEAQVRWEQTALDVKAAADFARSQPGITKVVAIGHSGGAPLMSLYEAIAENGPAYCQRPERIVKCTENYGQMKPLDGIVFPDAHPGNPVQALRDLNPSIVMKDGKITVIPELDPFSEANGYNPKGSSHYSPEFQAKYYAAQSKAMNDRLARVLAAQESINKGEYRYPDNDIVIIPGGGNPGAGAGGDGHLAHMDTSIPGFMWTVRPAKLLKNDGSISTQIVKSVAAPDPEMAKTNRAFDTGTKVFTFKSFLSANATRSANSLDAIEDCSSNNSTTCAVQSIHVPIMIAAMGGYQFVRDQEVLFEKSASADKDFVVIEGALHGYTPCRACETTPGQYSNTVKNLFDYIAAWTNKRF
jgi:dienelactone hydrolase